MQVAIQKCLCGKNMIIIGSRCISPDGHEGLGWKCYGCGQYEALDPYYSPDKLERLDIQRWYDAQNKTGA